MKKMFRVGQRVKIIRNLGARNNGHEDEYYHGGDTTQVRLGTRAVIKEVISRNEVELSFNGNMGGHDKLLFHPDELHSIEPRINLRHVRELERHPLFELAEQADVFVVDGKVYAAGEESKREGNYFHDQRVAGSVVRAISEVGTLESLDELASSRNEAGLEAIREKYRKEVLAEVGIGKIKTEEEMNVPQFIYDKVFPYLRGTGEYCDKVEKLLGSEKERQKGKKRKRLNEKALEEVTKNVLQELKEIRKYLEKDGRSPDSLSRSIDKCFQQEQEEDYVRFSGDFSIAGGIFYELKQTEDSEEGRLGLSLDKRKYSFKEIGKLKEVERKYLSKLLRATKLNLLKRGLEEELTNRLKQVDPSLTISKLREYEEGDFGFFYKRENFSVYINIPTFKLKCPYQGEHYNSSGDYMGRFREFYEFKSSRIAIVIKKHNGRFNYSPEFHRRSISSDEPWSNPSDRINWCMCVNGINLPTSGKDVGEVIAKRLRLMKTTIMQGGTPDWYFNEYTRFKMMD